MLWSNFQLFNTINVQSTQASSQSSISKRTKFKKTEKKVSRYVVAFCIYFPNTFALIPNKTWNNNSQRQENEITNITMLVIFPPNLIIINEQFKTNKIEKKQKKSFTFFNLVHFSDTCFEKTKQTKHETTSNENKKQQIWQYYTTIKVILPMATQSCWLNILRVCRLTFSNQSQSFCSIVPWIASNKPTTTT